jgi:glycosyltransferase involved in cell wall biosynthesis
MKIVYFYQYFGTPKGGWSTRVYEMCRRWAASGHEVTVVTSMYDKSDLVPTGLITKLDVEGIKVILINVKLSNKHNIVRRLWSFFMYSFLSIWYAITLRYNICITSSGPITVGVPGVFARFLRGKKWVFEIRDLWPEGAIQLNILKGKLAIKIARWFEKFCYRHSHLVVSSSQGQNDHILQLIPGKNTVVIPNASDIQLANETAGWPNGFQQDDKKIFVYIGTLGLIDDCMQIVRAAELLQASNRKDIQIVFVGDGKERSAIETYVLTNKVMNVRFTGLQPKTEVFKWLKVARASIFTVKDVEFLGTASPNKVFDSFATGTPIVQNSQGWIKDLFEQRKCGLNVPMNNATAMAQAIEKMADDDAFHLACTQNCFDLATNDFNRDKLSEKMLFKIKELMVSGK